MTKFEIISSREVGVATPRIIGSQQPRTSPWLAGNALLLVLLFGFIVVGAGLGLGLGLGLGMRSSPTAASTVAVGAPLTATAGNWTGFTSSPFAGAIVFGQAPGSSVVSVAVALSGLPSNTAHGIHIHALTDLSQGCGTVSHFNPSSSAHGVPANPVRHVGDFAGNVMSDALGIVALTFTDAVISLSPSSPNNVVGLAVVVHAQADDGSVTTSAGARLGCSLIVAPAVAVAAGWTGMGSAPFSGTVTFSQAASSAVVTIAVALTGLPPGTHGMHVHAITDTSAGCGTAGHLNPLGQLHSYPSNTTGRHVGDAGNIIATSDGVATAVLADNVMSLQPGSVNSIVGYLLVIHSGADDGVSQPSGSNGQTRIGCSLIVRQ